MPGLPRILPSLRTSRATSSSIGSEYDVGARAGQIRDDLLALKGKLGPADMLRIQLDDRAVFLSPWQGLALAVLDEQELAGHPRRAEFRRLVAGWDARASVDSVGYRLVRAFHERTRQAVWDMLLTGLGIPPEKENYAPDQFEGSLWHLVTEQPMHLLSANYPGWTEFLKAQLDATIDDLDATLSAAHSLHLGQAQARCASGTRSPAHCRGSLRIPRHAHARAARG